MANLVSAEQKKQYLNNWLEGKSIDHQLAPTAALKEFEALAGENGWDGKYVEEKKDDDNRGGKFEGENPTFKMRWVGILETRKGNRYDYVLENANDLDAFKAAKESDAQSRNYVNNAPAGHHWAFNYVGKKAEFKFATAVGRLVHDKKLSAAVALDADILTEDEIDNLSPNAMRILEMKFNLAAANKRLIAAGE